MKITVNLKLSDAEAARFRDLAEGGRLGVDEVATGIIQLYLSGQVHAPREDKLVAAVLAAVDTYRGKASQAQPERAGRAGRPGLLSTDQIAQARALKLQGRSIGFISERLGVGEWVVRRALRAA